jgi:hypothetical protein
VGICCDPAALQSVARDGTLIARGMPDFNLFFNKP